MSAPLWDGRTALEKSLDSGLLKAWAVGEGPPLRILNGVDKGLLCLEGEAGLAWKQEDVGMEVLLQPLAWEALHGQDHR